MLEFIIYDCRDSGDAENQTKIGKRLSRGASEKTDESLKGLSRAPEFLSAIKCSQVWHFKDSGFFIRWVNDTTALAVFKTPSTAQEACKSVQCSFTIRDHDSLLGSISGKEGIYATNNQFQKAGPKGFIHVKVLENDSLYVRVDLPGVPDDGVRHRVDNVRQKLVFFSGETPDDDNKKDGVREYSGSAGLGCDCCEITGVDAKMKDGVLRMILSRVKDHDNKCTHTLPPNAGKSGRHLEDHPFLVKGRKGAFVGAPLPGDGLYFAVDLSTTFIYRFILEGVKDLCLTAIVSLFIKLRQLCCVNHLHILGRITSMFPCM
ncbi:hypothetical protein N665_0109s0032 [Sinapis alba]|nr:hypothetical protein N665_0109s0032 [Sinapis alba]